MSYMYEATRRAGHGQEIVAPIDVEEARIPPPPPELLARPSRDPGTLFEERIAQHPWRPFAPSFPTFARQGPVLEQFRGLRSHIFRAGKEKPLKSILISSGLPSEGKSFVALNLAITMARHKDNKVLLIDGDLRRPALHALLGAPNECGLSDYLTGSASIHAAMQKCSGGAAIDAAGGVDLANITLIPAGLPRETSSELIANQKVKELLLTVSDAFNWILIDSPPVLVFADAVDLSRAADAVLLVVRGAQTTFDTAKQAQKSFGDSRILGVVLNDVKDPPRRGSYYGYGEYYGYGREPGRTVSDGGKAKK